ncbi:glutamyl-tRNA reductase, partial [Tenacibaculum discolor]
MTVLTLGLNHTTAAVDLRGRFAFAVDQLAPTLKPLHERLTGSNHPEVVLLSTCNRTELYCAAGGLGGPVHTLRHAAVDW